MNKVVVVVVVVTATATKMVPIYFDCLTYSHATISIFIKIEKTLQV